MSTENDMRSIEPADSGGGLARETGAGATPQAEHPVILIGKEKVPAEIEGRSTEVELFTMALGEEAIYLAPLKTWSQLDIHKWRVQGKLPGTPAGLDIGVDHVKIAGETVYTKDPDGCAKLEKAFNEWLALEWGAVEQAKQKAQMQAEQQSTAVMHDEPLRFKIELDKAGQAHIHCLEGNEEVNHVACTVPGINSLITEGLMKKPGSWKVGALRDWIELDGQLFRFKEGENGVAELERALNERYHPATEGGATQEVMVFENPASESGFDIQFPANDGGLVENRRRHLDPQAMELLSDPQRCRVLRKGVVVKFTPPTFHFKQKTTDGGEKDLEPLPENMVRVVGKDGHRKWVDLSQPINHLELGPSALAAIFNHPSITRRVKREDQSDWDMEERHAA